MRKFDDFDDFADSYHENLNDDIGSISGTDSDFFSEYKVKEVYKIEKHNIKPEILDLGCGDGKTGEFFIKYFESSNYTGIDISDNSIEIARNKNLKNTTFRVYDGEKIPFSDNSFDIIFIANVLHHVSEELHFDLLKECKRVLKEEGSIYIFEHNPLNPLTRKIVNNCVFDKDAVLIQPKKLIKKIKSLNFLKVKKLYTIFLPRKSFLNKLIFIEKFLYWCPLGGQYFLYIKKWH